MSFKNAARKPSKGVEKGGLGLKHFLEYKLQNYLCHVILKLRGNAVIMP